MVEVVCIGEPLIGMYGTSGQTLTEETQYRRTFGGDTSNFALALAKLGRSVGYVTKVGDDAFGKSFLALWDRTGVDTSQVKVERGGFTGLYISASSDICHEFMYYRKNSAASHLTRADIDEGYLRKAKVLHISGISQAISSACLDATLYALSLAREHGLQVSYDFNYRPALWSKELAQATGWHTISRYVDILLATQEELALLTGETDYQAAADRVLATGAKLVAVKLGAEGCYLVTAEESCHAPAYPVEVADTVGAGDAFAAATVAGLLGEMPLPRIARFANLVAALTCRGVGPVEAQPTREEVNGLL